MNSSDRGPSKDFSSDLRSELRVPDGWMLVPKTLSADMRQDVVDHLRSQLDYGDTLESHAKRIWAKLLSAAPHPDIEVVTTTEAGAGAKVYHLGAALRGIADEHANVLTRRQINALYMASERLWDQSDDPS